MIKHIVTNPTLKEQIQEIKNKLKLEKQERHFKSFAQQIFKTAKMQATVEGDVKPPLEIVVVCTAYIKPTNKAKVYFEDHIRLFRKWLDKNYFSPQSFSSIIRKYLPAGFYIDWLSGFSFAYDWSINSIRSFDTGTTPFTMDVRIAVPESIYKEINGKVSKLLPHIKPIYAAIDKTFNDIMETSEDMINIYYRK